MLVRPMIWSGYIAGQTCVGCSEGSFDHPRFKSLCSSEVCTNQKRSFKFRLSEDSAVKFTVPQVSPQEADTM